MNLIRIVELLGIAGIYLYFCRRFKISPAPIKIPVFGRLRTFHEVRNIFDNFGAKGELRDEVVEKYLSRKETPTVVDCGINVGITARWWFHLNRKARVFGIDMIEETQSFTVKALESIGIDPKNYIPVTTALWSETGKELKFGITDPLYGDYGFYRKDKEKYERKVITRTLDDIFGSQNIDEVDLLKIDLEGAAGDVLKAASGILKKTRHVVFEVHTDQERITADKILTEDGFMLRKSAGRHLWWERISRD